VKEQYSASKMQIVNQFNKNRLFCRFITYTILYWIYIIHTFFKKGSSTSVFIF